VGQFEGYGLQPANLARFWLARHYDFPVWARKKRIEELRHIHRNPVKRGLANRRIDPRLPKLMDNSVVSS